MSAESDAAALEKLDRAAANEEATKRNSEQQRQQIGEQRKQAAREAYLHRRNERQEKLREILAMEENSYEEYEAVCRVRAQLEKEKGPASSATSAERPQGSNAATAAPGTPRRTNSDVAQPPVDEDRELTPVEDPLEEL